MSGQDGHIFTLAHLRAGVVMAAVVGLVIASPAMATSMTEAANSVKNVTCGAFEAARKVLITAAVLAVIIGLAPMLWGQVKVKWIVSSLVVCVLFTVIPQMVSAFAGGASGCS